MKIRSVPIEAGVQEEETDEIIRLSNRIRQKLSTYYRATYIRNNTSK